LARPIFFGLTDMPRKPRNDGLMVPAAYSEHAGVSRATVKRWMDKGIIPVISLVERGKPKRLIDPAEADAAREHNLQHAKKRGEKSGAPNPPKPKPAEKKSTEPRAGSTAHSDQRAKAADAELKEINLAEKKGQMVRKDAVDAQTLNIVSSFDAALRGLGSKMADRVAHLNKPGECKQAIDNQIQEALSQLRAGLMGLSRDVRSKGATAGGGNT
jgi:hypothetical protein